jgi:hypothetical protein
VSLFNTLLYGDLTEILELIEIMPLEEHENRAALQNIIGHVTKLEENIEKIDERLSALEGSVFTFNVEAKNRIIALERGDEERMTIEFVPAYDQPNGVPHS